MVKSITAGKQAPSAYVPMMFTAPGKKPMIISFPKGTDIAVDGKDYPANKPGAIQLDAKHYEALLKADATGDRKINADDAKAINAKKAKSGITADKFGVNVPLNPKDDNDSHRVGIFFPGYIQHNQSTPGVD